MNRKSEVGSQKSELDLPSPLVGEGGPKGRKGGNPDVDMRIIPKQIWTTLVALAISGAMAAEPPDIIREWGSVKAPPAPELSAMPSAGAYHEQFSILEIADVNFPI